MMNRSYGLPLVALLLVGGAAIAGDVLWQADFSAAVWGKPKIYSKVDVTAKGNSLSVVGLLTNYTDTAWQMTSTTMPLVVRGKYAVAFNFKSEGITKNRVGTSAGYDSAIFWYGADGKQLARHPFAYAFADGPSFDYRHVFEAPEKAAAFRVKLGFDGPNFTTTNRICFTNFRLEKAAADEPLGGKLPDLAGPRIRIVSETPTRAVTAPVVVRVSDPSGVDAASVKVVVDGTPRTDFVSRTEGGDLLVSIPAGSTPWSEGLHKIGFSAADTNGRVNNATKFFLIGDKPTTPAVTLRDDGMTLIGGQPFFPIGIYGVCKRDFNAYCWDRALSDLKAAGFNTVHSYGAPRDPEFHAVAAKYDMKMWMAAYTPDKAIVDTFRHDPVVIAWYLGDDTSAHATPEQLHDRDDNIRAIDPTRITTQADPLVPEGTPDNYLLYAPATDNFLPEIYPVHGTNPEKDRKCVAQVVLEMKKIDEDVKANGGNRRHSNWPIIQYFKGWGWQRFPTWEEFYGMNFAAIINGAQGITWYTYGGFVNPEKKKFNYGVTSSEEVWRNTTNATRRIASLLPVLTERKPVQPVAPKVIAGPQQDALGNSAVTALLKSREGDCYYMVVNAADAAVTAAFAPSAPAEIEVLWENRTIKTDGKGGFTDKFGPLGVHVYHWRR